MTTNAPFTVGKLSAATANGAVATTFARYRRANASTQAITNATPTKVQFPTVVEADSNVVPSGTSNIDWTLNRAGLWTIDLTLTYAPNATGIRYAWIELSTAERIASHNGHGISAAGLGNAVNLSVTCRFAVGVVLAVYAYQTSGGSLNVAPEVGTSPTVIAFTWHGL